MFYFTCDRSLKVVVVGKTLFSRLFAPFIDFILLLRIVYVSYSNATMIKVKLSHTRPEFYYFAICQRIIEWRFQGGPKLKYNTCRYVRENNERRVIRLVTI